MTITATFEPELSRVHIVGSDLEDGTITVERSINQVLWMTVRGGNAVEIINGIFTLDDYEFFDGVENFYRIRGAVQEEFTTISTNQEFGDPWDVPPNVRSVTVECWGGGGAGQGNFTSSLDASRSGGGGAAYARGDIDVIPGETLSVLVGEGGDILGASHNGQDGSDSGIFRGNDELVKADRGFGAVGFSIPGSGGNASFSTGDVTFSGGGGGSRNTSTGGGGGGGGGSAFRDADGEFGGNALDAEIWQPGPGGIGGEGFGDGGNGGSIGVEEFIVTDEFNRVETDTWGTTTSGQEWIEEGGDPSDSQVDGNSGIVTLQSDPSEIRWKRIQNIGTDGEFLVQVSPDQVATGGNFFPAVFFRFRDVSNFYRCRINFDTNGDVNLHAVRVNTLIGSEVSTGLTYQPDDVFWHRTRIDEQRIRSKVWLDGMDEPEDWMLDVAVTSSPIDYGLYGLTISASGSNTNIDPTFTYGSFESTVQTIAADEFDFFNRVDLGTWGTTTGFSDWIEDGGTTSDRGVTNGEAIMVLNNDTEEHRIQTLDVDYSDTEIFTAVTIGQTASGGTLAFAPTMRFVDTDNFYLARVHFTAAGNVFLSVWTTSEGQVGSNQSSGFTYNPDDEFFVRVQLNGQTMRIRVWPDGDNEPSTWQIERTASNGTIASGRVGLNFHGFSGNNNDSPSYQVSHFFADPEEVQPIINAEMGEVPGAGGGGQSRNSQNVPLGANGARGTVLIDSWIGGEEEITSVTPDLDGQVWLKSIRFPFLNRPVECTPFGEITREFRGQVHNIMGRNVPTAVVDRRGSRAFTITVVTRTLEEARDMDLILAANTIMFIHTPFEDPEICDRPSAVPGGYVVIQATTQRRAMAGSHVFAWDLPCRVVSAPAPNVVGTTMTWGTVLRLYGTWEALVASNPTWRDLLENVSSPDDLVVL